MLESDLRAASNGLLIPINHCAKAQPCLDHPLPDRVCSQVLSIEPVE